MKTALVIRYGAFGDILIASPVFKALKRDGYHVTLNCINRALPVVHNSPYIDEIILHEDNSVPPDKLEPYWKDIAKGFDYTVNLSETLEGKFLFIPGRKEYDLPVEERRKLAGSTNYYDFALEVAGYPSKSKPLPELYPTELETAHCRLFRKKKEDKFIILWALSGSGMHKAYAYAEEVAISLLNKYDDIMTITVGDEFCRLLEWSHPRQMSKSSEWDIRTVLLMTKHVDFVIGPETGVCNAAGCYSTPKLLMLTHSNKVNLTRYYRNDFSMQADLPCSPCHRLIYVDNYRDCPLMDLGEGAAMCACCAAFNPAHIYNIIEAEYFRWHNKRRTRPKINKGITSLLYGPQGQKLHFNGAEYGNEIQDA
jgi:ADP-heptose:LPS heptosyltransferase